MKRLRRGGIPPELRSAHINDADAAVARKLGELTELEAFGAPAAGKGRIGWLTEQGLYNGNGPREPWDRFNGFEVDIPQKGTHRILLRRPEPGHLDVSETWQGRYLAGRVCLFAVPAVFTYLGGGLIGYHFNGMRLDVLADLLCSILPLPLIVMWLAAAYGRSTLGLSRNVVVIVNEKTVPLDDVCELLKAQLPMID